VSNGYLLNSVQCPDTRRCVKEALAGGWEWVGITRQGHLELCWPPTDQRIFSSTTPSSSGSWKHLARDIERVSGLVVWRRAKRRPGKSKAERKAAAETQANRERTRAQSRTDRLAADRAARERRQVEASVIVARDRERRGIESLMRPGYGR
jgi:hypothetical protein